MAYVNCPNCDQKALSVATRCPRCGVAFEGRFFAPSAPVPRRIPRIVMLAAGAVGVLLVLNLVPWKVGIVPAVPTEGMGPPKAADSTTRRPDTRAAGGSRDAVTRGRSDTAANGPTSRREGLAPEAPGPGRPRDIARVPVEHPASPTGVGAPPVARQPAAESVAVREPAAVVAQAPAPAPPEPPEVVRREPEAVLAARAVTRDAMSREPLRGEGAGLARYANTWVNVRSGRSPSAPVTRVLNPGETVAVDRPEQGWYRVTRAGQVVGYVDGRFLDTSPPDDTP